MRLPNVHLAIVEPEKIVDYILSPAHPGNGGKALFFSSMGFRRTEWGPLATAFRKAAESHPVAENMASPHGRNYIVGSRSEALVLRSCAPTPEQIKLVEEGTSA
jgi:hypothetical protein